MKTLHNGDFRLTIVGYEMILECMCGNRGTTEEGFDGNVPEFFEAYKAELETLDV